MKQIRRLQAAESDGATEDEKKVDVDGNGQEEKKGRWIL